MPCVNDEEGMVLRGGGEEVKGARHAKGADNKGKAKVMRRESGTMSPPPSHCHCLGQVCAGVEESPASQPAWVVAGGVGVGRGRRWEGLSQPCQQLLHYLIHTHTQKAIHGASWGHGRWWKEKMPKAKVYAQPQAWQQTKQINTETVSPKCKMSKMSVPSHQGGR